MKYFTWPAVSVCRLVEAYKEKAEHTDYSLLPCAASKSTVTTFSGIVFFLDFAFSGHTFSAKVLLFNAILALPFKSNCLFRLCFFRHCLKLLTSFWGKLNFLLNVFQQNWFPKLDWK